MNYFKKLLAVALVTALCATILGACGKKEEPVAAGNPYEAELISKGKIIVGTSPDYPPYESLNTKGEAEGFDIDMMHEVAKYMAEGGNPIEVEFKSMSFDTIVTALQAGQVDVGVSAFTYDPQRDVQFSTPYLISEQMVAVTKESGIQTLADLEGKKIGAGTGTTGEAAAKEQIPGAQVSSPGDYGIMFEALKNGALDAVVCDGLVAKNYAAASDLAVLDTALISEENSIIVKNGNTELIEAVNAAVAKFMESDSYVELQKKWGIISE